MKKFPLVVLFAFLSTYSFAQDWHVGALLGASNYSGDLSQQRVDFKYTRFAAGLLVKRDINRYLTMRLGFNWGHIAGADSTNTNKFLQQRNLSFRSVLWEVNLLAEINLLDMEETGYTPYLLVGLAGFSFYPTTKDANGNTVRLRRMSTEGEGLPQYPDRPMYSIDQVSIPFGVGFKYMATDRIMIGGEIGIRKTFTDYLDDVSKTYVDQNTLAFERGQSAVDIAYRGDEVTKNNTPGVYPADGTIRGNPKLKDWYSFSGITITYKLGNNSGGYGRWNKQKVSNCPKF